jgi:alkaline phosphatase
MPMPILTASRNTRTPTSGCSTTSTPTAVWSQVRDIISATNGHTIAEEDAKTVLSYYDGLHKEDGGLYNYKKLPFAFVEMQKKTNSVGWISMHHSADYVELAMPPGSDLLKPFVKIPICIT